MNLGFYYHIPFYRKNNTLFAPSFLGVFLNELANNCNQLVLFHHEADDDPSYYDYELKENTFTFVSLGIAKSAWSRTFFTYPFLKKFLKGYEYLDFILVRTPTPLSPHFSKYFDINKIVFLIVGDYLEGAEHLLKSTLRDRIIYYYLYIFDKLLNREIKRTLCAVNSKALFLKYQSIAKDIFEVRTTTVSKNDFYKRSDSCLAESVNLLYTGRIDPAKGLFELVQALPILNSSNRKFILNIVGWEDGMAEPVKGELQKTASRLGVADQVVFHGKKSVGEELNKYYRMADIYCIPSYHEGFPRTIWESMANSCPVIATKVGGIPELLTDRVNAILIEPGNVESIVEAIKLVISDDELRRNLISNAFEYCLENTLEHQTQKLVEKIINAKKTLPQSQV